MNIDHVRIQRFLEHTLPWSDLSRHERSAAVDEMRRRGLTGREAEDAYGINHTYYVGTLRRWESGKRKTPIPRPYPAPQPELKDVPCRGDARFTSLPIHTSLIGVCHGCDQRVECLEITRPQTSYFDGVCGGIAWINGRPITGTETGNPCGVLGCHDEANRIVAVGGRRRVPLCPTHKANRLTYNDLKEIA